MTPCSGGQAKAEAQSQQLQREKLAGEKKTVAESASQENAAYKLLVRRQRGSCSASSLAKSHPRMQEPARA